MDELEQMENSSCTPLRPVITARLYREGKCFGPGVAMLLRRVRTLRSLRAAAMDMDMAYSKAWTMVRRCEGVLGFSLLTSATGGRGGGGAALTQEARTLLACYHDYRAQLEHYAQALFAKTFAPFLKEDGHGL